MTGERDFNYDPQTHPFDSHTTAYCGNNALCLAAMANLAYEKKGPISTQVSKWGFPNFEFFKEPGGTEAFIAGDSDKIIVSFRGTEPTLLVDWLTDINIVLINRLGGRVHNGFYHGVNRVWPKMRRCITKFQNNKERPQSLWFTGHSLGAALATIAVARLRHEEDKPVYGLYTFGHPRTGDRDFAAAINGDTMTRTFRFVNNNDIVTRVPTREMEYRHVGRLLYFTTDKRLETDISFWSRFLDRIGGRIEALREPGTDGISDHDMNNYVDLVRRHVSAVPVWR